MEFSLVFNIIDNSMFLLRKTILDEQKSKEAESEKYKINQNSSHSLCQQKYNHIGVFSYTFVDIRNIF